MVIWRRENIHQHVNGTAPAGNGKMPQAKAPELVVKFKPKKINQVIYSD